MIYPFNACLAQLVERNVANVQVAGSNPVARTTHIMYKIYFTDPKSQQPYATTTQHLEHALKYTESLRQSGMLFVTMVSDYADMVGKPGAKGAGSEYVAQLKN